MIQFHCLCTTCSQRDSCMLLASPQRALQQLLAITALLPISAGKGPFEVASKDLTCALILWADIQHFPDKLSQPCTSFIQVYHASHHTSTSLLCHALQRGPVQMYSRGFITRQSLCPSIQPWACVQQHPSPPQHHPCLSSVACARSACLMKGC